MSPDRFVLMVAVSLLGACAANREPVAEPILLAPVGIDLTDVTPAELPQPAADVFALTPAMEAFLTELVAERDLKRERLLKLERAVHASDALGIEYDPAATLTVAETFSNRRGNCLSLSLMFAAMVRQLGIDARFQEVSVDPYWDQRDGVVFSARHINVIGRLPRGHYVLDFYRASRGEKPRPMRPLSDDEAIAQYYNNLGAQALAQDELARAFLHFRAAIELAPEVSYFWSNVAVLYQRSGQLEDAERMYRYAIYTDDDNVSAYANLARLLKQSGRDAEAETYLAEIDRAQRLNPFYHFAEAENLMTAGEFDRALKSIDKAIKLKPDELVFYKIAHSMANATDDRYKARAYVKAALRAASVK